MKSKNYKMIFKIQKKNQLIKMKIIVIIMKSYDKNS